MLDDNSEDQKTNLPPIINNKSPNRAPKTPRVISKSPSRAPIQPALQRIQSSPVRQLVKKAKPNNTFFGGDNASEKSNDISDDD